MLIDITDEQLKQRCRDDRDYLAFETLYHRHKNPLYRYVLRQCSDEEQAKDIVQDTWLSVHKACGNYVHSAKFTTWLYKIAHNRLIDYYRRNKNGTPVSYQDLSEQEMMLLDNRFAVDDLIQSLQQREQLLKVISHLQEAQRETVLLHLEMGFSVAEIAHITQVNPETAKSRLRYALKKIRQQVLDEK